MKHDEEHAELPADIPGFTNFGHIDLQKLHNTRDLGGMPTKEGKSIKPNCLIRSSALHKATDADLKVLVQDHHLKQIVDFRTDVEAGGKEDPVGKMEGVSYIHLPVFEMEALGITHGGGMEKDIQSLIAAGSDAHGMVTRLYSTMMVSEEGKRAYGSFFKVLLETEQGATLWHCTEGKDRAGMATVLVEAALGVSEENIRKDYLATNIFVRTHLRRIADALAQHKIAKLIDLDIDSFFYAYSEYLDAAIDSINKAYGSMGSYLKDALGVGQAEQNELRSRFLQ